MARIFAAVCLILFVAGCSLFQGSRKINLEPFAENAQTMFGEAVKISRPYQWQNLKRYTTIPELRELIVKAIPVLEALRGIVYYSNQVVAINNAKISDKQKNHELAIYLEAVMEKALSKQKTDSIRLDLSRAEKVLQDIRNADKYLDGIAAASPIINAVVVAVLDRLDEIEALIPGILIAMDREIEKDYGSIRKNYLRLKILQNETMLSMTRLYRAQVGDPAELDTMLQEDASLRKFIPASGSATAAQLATVEVHLSGRLNQIDAMFRQLEDDKQEYQAKQNELTAWRIQVDEKIRIARTAMTVWAQSHRNLGAGIPVPPMIDVAGFTTGLVGGAAGKIVP